MTPEAVLDFIQAIKAGSTINTAAEHADLEPETVKSWIKFGKRDQSKKELTQFQKQCVSFYKKYRKAQADAVLDHELRISLLSKSTNEAISLKANTWWLERRQKKDYALRQEITGNQGEPVILSATEAFETLESIFRD